MANGIDWFRWHHGSVTDPKFQLVAKKAGVRLGDVMVVWAFVLEKASSDADRGFIGPIDFETLDFLIGGENGDAIRILDALSGRGLIDGNRVANWEKRQPKREREDSTASERKRRQRTNEATENQVTPCHATSRQKTPRGEESREEEPKLPNGSLSPVEPATLPICPHQRLIALYAKHLPDLPQPRSWEGQRQQHLTARWRWVLTAKKPDGARWATDTESALSFFDRFFAHVAKSRFLTGKTSDWSCDIGWLVKAENFAKVIDGKYDDREAA